MDFLLWHGSSAICGDVTAQGGHVDMFTCRKFGMCSCPKIWNLTSGDNLVAIHFFGSKNLGEKLSTTNSPNLKCLMQCARSGCRWPQVSSTLPAREVTRSQQQLLFRRKSRVASPCRSMTCGRYTLHCSYATHIHTQIDVNKPLS